MFDIQKLCNSANIKQCQYAHLTHSYLFNKKRPPNYDYCRSPLTVEHILASCSVYKNIREKHYHHSQLSHILNIISKQHIFNYLS